jgi:tRNA A-37 threonylcarbamoyl transferase component Bud32
VFQIPYSPLQREHEALITLLAERGSVPVLPVIATGTAAHGDALLVTEMMGRRLESLDREDVSDDIVRDAWTTLDQLHELGLAHGQVNGHRVVITEGSSPALADFGRGRVIATQHEQMTDRSELLVTMALAVGHERAIHATHAALVDSGLADVLPFLQPTVLERETVRDVGEQDWSLKELRELAADVVDSEPPELAKIRRVTAGGVAKLVLAALLVSGLIGAFAGVDFQEVVDELQSANVWLLLAALAMSPVVQLGQALSTTGASIQTVSYGPVLMLQYAIQFIGLAVPSSAARLALEIRFFQCVGVKAGAATRGGMPSESISATPIRAICSPITISGLASLDFSTSSSTSSGSSESDSSSTWILSCCCWWSDSSSRGRSASTSHRKELIAERRARTSCPVS